MGKVLFIGLLSKTPELTQTTFN